MRKAEKGTGRKGLKYCPDLSDEKTRARRMKGGSQFSERRSRIDQTRRRAKKTQRTRLVPHNIGEGNLGYWED